MRPERIAPQTRMNKMKEEKDERITYELGRFHFQESVRIYNEALALMEGISEPDICQERVIILLKRAIPHILKCRDLEYHDDRLEKVIKGLQIMVNWNNTRPIRDLQPIAA